MKLPSEPQLEYSIRKYISGLLRYIRAENVTAIRGGRIDTSPNGKTLVIDFPPPPPPPSTPCPLTPYIRFVDPDYNIYVTPGLSGDLPPLLDGTPLIDDPPPFLTLSLTGIYYLWIVAEWEPIGYYDSLAAEYYITGGGTLISAEFVVDASRPTETEAEIDPVTGAATNGVYAFCWAVITDASGTPTIVSKRCGNHQFSFCPGSLKLIFD